MGTSTKMSDVQAVIEARRRQLDQKPLWRALDSSSNVDDVRAIAPQGAFYVFGFQDMLRLTQELVVDPELREIATNLRGEDAGHEDWFVWDLGQLGLELDAVWLFGEEHRVTRDVTYGLIGQLLRAEDDRVRVVFPLVLEAAGSLFFRRVVALLHRAGFDRPLRYFARSHQEAEEEHDIFSDAGSATLAGISFDPVSHEAAVQLVHACFDYFERFMDHLEHHRVLNSGV